ncbi:MAG: class I SAM-dependent RNA methyltransferase [Deltaproteobacteria bacterium]|nr:class I SAM-dependent RNA methyltransferase [Deltaproteobacteria bacterium]
MANPEIYKIYVVCTPGLEPFTKGELQKLGLFSEENARSSGKAAGKIPAAEETGGIEGHGTLRDVYRANLNLRTATRILVTIGQFPVQAFPALRQKASHLPWEQFLKPGQPIALRVACHRSRLYHSGAVAEYVTKALADRLGMEPPVQKLQEEDSSTPPQLIGVRITDNICAVSVDSSGTLLYRRGYRLATAKAPIRETLAAGMVLASGWDRKSPLLDPFCGAGTLAIEAAMMARGIKPGGTRHFVFMDWPNYSPEIWAEVLKEKREGPRPPFPLILASDRDAGAIKAAEENARRAGISDSISFSRRSFSAVEPPARQGWVITNPPYGLRTRSGKDLRTLYRMFGQILREKCRGWKVAMLCDNPSLARSTGIDFDSGIPVFHGGLKVRLYRGQIG